MSGPLAETAKRIINRGKGWWLNKPKNIVKEIASSDLGPNGDHDGWIGIGRNAKDLGVDPIEAKAMQRGSYGFYLPQKITKEWLDQGGTPMDVTRGRAFYQPTMGDDFGPANELFENLYGMEPWEAATMVGSGNTLDDLMRVRLWLDKSELPKELSVDSGSGVTPGALRQWYDAVNATEYLPPDIPVSVVDDKGNYKSYPLGEALARRRFKLGGLV